MPQKTLPGARWFFLISILALLGVIFGILFWRSLHIDNFTRDWVIRELSDRFDTKVELADLHVSAFPEMSVEGHNLVIYHRDKDYPFIAIDRFVFHLGALGIFSAPHEIRSVSLNSMTITIPPRGQKKPPQDPNAPPENKKALPAILVYEIICEDTKLVILPKVAGKLPLEWDIHALTLFHAGASRSMAFRGTLTNAKPQGEIATTGNFGPWNLEDKGATPVNGNYDFTNADLGPFPGIAGILSSTGKYTGQLDTLEVTGETDTPDFSLDRVGKPVPLHTDYAATVDGLNGDTYLHPVRATLTKSVIISEGSVVNVPHRGHNISLDIHSDGARVEDILALAMKDDTPLLRGPAVIKAKLFLPPGKVKVIEKMVMDANVSVDNARWSSPKIREELQSFSRRAEGKVEDQDAGSAVSNLQAEFHVDKGAVHFSSLTFSVPGASVDLVGDYGVRDGELNFKGHVRLQAKISDLVTGAKSVLLKPLDPFFSKNGAGTELPVTITGTRDAPTFAVSIFHKTFSKTISGNGAPPKQISKSN